MSVGDSAGWIDCFDGTDTHETSLRDSILGPQAVVIGDCALIEVPERLRNDRELHIAPALVAVLVLDAAQHLRNPPEARICSSA